MQLSLPGVCPLSYSQTAELSARLSQTIAASDRRYMYGDTVIVPLILTTVVTFGQQSLVVGVLALAAGSVAAATSRNQATS